MKMKDVKSITWVKVAEVKTRAKTPTGIYKVLCREFGVDFYENAFEVEAAIAEGYVQVCDDGIIVWMS
jgi:hypothetical protein